MKKKLTLFVLSVICTLFSMSTIDAQCSGTVTLSTQTQVNNFMCSTFYGTVIIEDDNDGVDDIVSINILWQNQFTNVTGDLILRNNDALNSAQGLDRLVTIGGNFVVEDNPVMEDLGYDAALSDVSGSILIQNNPNLTKIIIFVDLINVGSDITIENNTSLIVISDFDELATVGGGIIIRDNPALNNLNTFENIATLGGSFILENNDALEDFLGFPLLTTAGDIFIQSNSSLLNIDEFTGLTSLNGTITITNNESLTTIADFNNVTSLDNTFIFNNISLTAITDFDALTTINSIDISNNTNLTVIPEFTNITSITGNFILQSNGLSEIPDFNTFTFIGGTLTIHNHNITSLDGFTNLSNIGGLLSVTENNSLMGVTAFTALSTVGGNLVVTNNSSLSDCCWLLPIIENTSGSISIFGNATGCDSQSAIGGEAPQITCVPDFTVDASIGACTGSVTMTDPSPTDDCDDITSYTLTLLDAEGTLVYDEVNASAGLIETLELPVGINTYTYTAIDGSGNVGTCTTLVTVMDIVAPTITCTPDFSVNVDPGGCTGEVTTTDPTPTDDCSEIASYTIDLVDANGVIIYNGATATAGLVDVNILPAGVNTYTYTVTDAAGNVSTCQTLVTVVDNINPTWVDTDNTTTVIGECGIDDGLALLNANLPDAVDNCITLSVSLISNETSSICGGSEETVYTFEATDAAGNVSVPYTLIVALEDSTPPVFSPVPPDETISCNDTAPSPPTLTASDQCAGDISGDVAITESSIFGNCENGTTQEERTYTYTVDDGCGNITTATWTLFINNDFSVDLGPDVAVCDEDFTVLDAGQGNTFLWSTGETTQTIIVSTNGTYTVDVVSNNGCCEADEIDVFFDSAPNASATGAQLDCSGSAVQIMGSSTTSGVTYAWTGPGGYSSNEQNPLVTGVGIYTLAVTNENGCIGTADAEVTANTDVPDLTATGGTITCTTTAVQLMSSSTESGVTYAWSGPGGYISTDQNPTVSVVGTYTITITAPNACVASTTVEVSDDTVIPSATATAGVLTCGEMSTQIMTDASADVTGFAWTGPGGFASMDENPTVSEVGTYTLEVTAANGCTSTTTVSVTGDFDEPNASASGGTLDCSASQVLLSGSSTTANVSYAWTGPNGFTSNLQNPQVSDLGTYTLTVTSLNGCTSTATAEVEADADLPQVSGVGGTIDCNTTTIQLMGSSTTADVTLSWTGPNGFISNDANPLVNLPGTYMLTALAANGCSATQSVLVEDDTAAPEITFALGDVDCDAGLRILSAQTTISGLMVSWSGPNGFSSESLAVNISEAGTYTLTTFPENGCDGTHTFVLDEDIAYTQMISTTDITSGNPTGSATIMITGGTGPFTIVWDNGDTGESATGLTGGDHTVTVTDGLGCMSTFDFVINESTSTFEQSWIEDIKLFPNPASDQITIELSENVKFFDSIDLYTMNGQLVKSIPLNNSNHNISISVYDWTPGMYMARINTHDSYHTMQFMVK